MAETGGFRLLRIFTTGQKRGVKEIVIENINGYPDNLKFNEKGELWLATPAIRDNIATFIARNPIVRRFFLMTRTPI